ncbi:hypothetical protein HRW14_31725 [Streptomyces lunaelactis]|uniref:hypothetical protein n=1 Tax=Streptomyces lunaelactis TaxID=1535768 RepID=UPI00158498EA|nr:hypothetical protein [Streptomyces lunaelactis]NUK54750.1 hypothetical protein [Streptomyces lunaelactis]NUK68457.1 hypothetical protein [Streptomyces lunaelactis]
MQTEAIAALAASGAAVLGVPAALIVGFRQARTAHGPAVIGQWDDDRTARRTYRDWIGLCGTTPSVCIKLTEEGDGVQRTLRTWTARGESVTGPDEQGD